MVLPWSSCRLAAAPATGTPFPAIALPVYKGFPAAWGTSSRPQEDPSVAHASGQPWLASINPPKPDHHRRRHDAVLSTRFSGACAAFAAFAVRTKCRRPNAVHKQKSPVRSAVAALGREGTANPSPNVDFYHNELLTTVGNLVDVHGWKEDYITLEQNHAYIQWLFPNYFSSRFNPAASALTPEEAHTFREDPDIAQRYLRSYRIFLDFLGLLLLDPVSGAVARSLDGEDRLRTALVKNPHNQLRVQRVLASLAVTGFKRYVAPLASHLEWEITGCQERVLSSVPLSGWCSLQKPALRALAGNSRFLDDLVAFADGNADHYQQMTRAAGPADDEDSVILRGLSSKAVVEEVADESQSRPLLGGKMSLTEELPSSGVAEWWSVGNFPSIFEDFPSMFKKSSKDCCGQQKVAKVSGSKSCFTGSWRSAMISRGRELRSCRAAAAASLGHGTPPGAHRVARRLDLIQRFQLPEHYLAEAYDWSYADTGPGPFKRGGEDYFPPYGFDKLGLSTVKFDDYSFMDREHGWHIAYHGTDPEDLLPIIEEGLRAKGGRLHPKHGSKYGDGIYVSWKPTMARSFAGEKRVGEQNTETEIILMARVRPGAYSVHDNGDVWLITNPDDIRCHSLLFARK